MAETIGKLESFEAYRAVYAMLHPDVRANVPFEAMACSYAALFGPPQTDETLTIYSTEVTDVTWVNWTWPANDTPFASVAEVAYTQKIGLFPKSEESDPMIEHWFAAMMECGAGSSVPMRTP
jgi:hypothetical protein